MILTLSTFGVTPLFKSLKGALGHGFHGILSGNALNFNWILTHVLHVFYPDRFGSLVEGRARIILTESQTVMFVPRLLFFLSYTITLVSFFKRDKTFEDMINLSLTGYFSYFIFNVGVHENHLFLIVILSIIMFWINRNHLSLMITLILMNNINLFVFYGIDGMGLRFSRVIAHTVDIALLLSIFNVSFFLVLWTVNTLRSKATNADQQALAPDRASHE